MRQLPFKHLGTTVAKAANRRHFLREAAAAGVLAARTADVMPTASLSARTTMSEDQELEQAILTVRAATAEFMNGRPAAWKAMISREPDATLFGGWGGHEQGWEELGPRYDWAAARFMEGEVTFEELTRHVTDDLAATVHLERATVRLTGAAEAAPMTLRVTHLYRREEAGWKLIHRHADHLIAIQPAESVVER